MKCVEKMDRAKLRNIALLAGVRRCCWWACCSIVTNHNNESILVSVRGDDYFQMRGDKVYVRADLLRYDIPYADLCAFLDAYDSGALPEGTQLTIEALEQYCERQ